MAFGQRWSDRNLSRLELLASVSVLLVLAGMFMHYAERLLTRAERQVVESTIINLGTALNYWAVMARIGGDEELLRRLVYGNPFEFMDVADTDASLARLAGDALGADGTPHFPIVRVANYAGETSAPESASLEKGHWYYFPGQHMVIYVVRSSRSFHSEPAGLNQIWLRLQSRFVDLDGNGRFDAGTDTLGALTLVPVTRYKWSG